MRAPRRARRNAGQDGLGELVRAHRRGARRLEPEGRPDGQRDAPRPGRVVGRGDRRRGASASRPSSSRISPDSAPAIAGPRRPSGGSGGGPAAGATSRKLTTPSSSATHRTASHQPSGASDGRPIPARSVRSPIADLVLAEERRTGRRESVGHRRQDSRARRRVHGRVGRRCRARSALGGGRVAAASARRRRVGRRGPRPRRSRSPRCVGGSGVGRIGGRIVDGGDGSSSVATAASRRAPASDGLGGLLGGLEGVGLGLEVGDLGLELEPEDLALDRRGRAGPSACASAGGRARPPGSRR